MSPGKRPRKDPVEERRSRLDAAREAPESPGSLDLLRKGLSDRVQVVVARAAQIVSELSLAALAPELVAAFDRLLVEPTKSDKGCLGKTAVVEALVRLEHPDPDVFFKGIRHVQLEPSWGGPRDVAAELRSAAASGLVQSGHRDVLPQLVDLLSDPEKPARIGAARALAQLGRQEGSLVLRLKLHLGDLEPEVVAECFHAFLNLDGSEDACGFVGCFLSSKDPVTAEAASIALGETRHRAAFPVLKSAWESSVDPSRRRVHLVSIALLRNEPANEFLVSLIESRESGSDEDARGALSALAPFLYGDALRERVQSAVAGRRDSRLENLLEETLGRG